MKQVAIMTSHVMEGVSHLPGVATQDWCDRAADSIARIWHPSAVGVMIGSLDARGFITAIELTGAAPSRGSQPHFGPRSAETEAYITPLDDAASKTLNQVRHGYAVGDWIGWTFGPPTSDLLHVASAQQLGMLQRRGESVVCRRWSSFAPNEVLAGVVAIPGAPVGRVVIVEVAWRDGPTQDSARQQAVLAAVLPLLASKICRTFGVEPLEPSGFLTPREELVLWRLLAGQKVPVIAEALNRSVYTVHDHVKSLHRKLNANNRGQLVARALGHLGPLTPSTEADGSADGPSEPDAEGDNSDAQHKTKTAAKARAKRG